MIIWRVIASVLLAACACLPVKAQQTKAQMNTYNNSVIIPNGVGAITASNLHPLLQNMINSACTIADPVNCPISALSGATANLPLIGAASGGGVTQSVLPVPSGGTGETTFTPNLPLIGNGSGPILQGTRSGNTTAFVTADTTPVNGQCAQWDAAGGLIPVACPGGGTGSGTVSAGLRGQIAAYAAAGTTVVGIPLQCIPIETFGGGTGVANNQPALDAALTALSSGPGGGSGCISFGTGTYTFTAPENFSYTNATAQSIMLAGAGPDATVLQWGNTNGIVFSMAASAAPSFHLENLTFATSGTTGFGFIATFFAAQLPFPPQSDITNVTFRADVTGSRTHHWGTGISLQGISYVNMTNTNVYGMPTPSSGTVTGGAGTGLSITGYNALSSYGVIFNIANSNFATNQTGIFYGDFVQGVAITNTNINFNTVGIQTVSSPAGTLAGLLVTNSSLNNYGNNILTNAHLDGLEVSNNLFIMFASSVGIFCSPCDNSSITGNHFSALSASGTVGVDLQGTNTGSITVVGNTFTGNAIGVVIGSGVSAVNLQSNAYLFNTGNVSNAGAIHAGTCTGIGGTCIAGATF